MMSLLLNYTTALGAKLITCQYQLTFREETMEDYADVPTADLLELAKLRLAHVRRSLPCETRGQALSILLGIRPAPPRTTKLAIKPVYERCGICWKPLIAGEPCDSLGKWHIA